MYVAVKGGETAIDNSYKVLAERRRGDRSLPGVSVEQIMSQMRLGVGRTMAEGSLYDPLLAALALKQAAGDVTEAIFLLRAHRTTLPRFGYCKAFDTLEMHLERRISATFKDVPGGQLLGPTYDYTQRLLDFSLLDQEDAEPDSTIQAHSRPNNEAGLNQPLGTEHTERGEVLEEGAASRQRPPRVTDMLTSEGLIESETSHASDPDPIDLTREPLRFPASRTTRLQNLARADEGFLLGMAYSTQRGYAHTHPFAAEIRFGQVAVKIFSEELGFEISIGEIELTECQMINQFSGSHDTPAQFTKGYGLVFGHQERKAMAMSLVDRALRAQELGEAVSSPAQMQEFVLSHSDNLESSGFIQHLKLPHYVDFQSELELVRKLREKALSQGDENA